ncbi:hypothetical protein PIB30_094974 [Stylosanthes scabra]|uniref:Uncharacterized protein n=1 Tax=Stylosanthes scabra TaxID=79078 RepID=A0ABU6XUW5_9FABA|nr:hypothetical protein [Stylosanthes scabra]
MDLKLDLVCNLAARLPLTAAAPRPTDLLRTRFATCRSSTERVFRESEIVSSPPIHRSAICRRPLTASAVVPLQLSPLPASGSTPSPCQRSTSETTAPILVAIDSP